MCYYLNTYTSIFKHLNKISFKIRLESLKVQSLLSEITNVS